MIIIALLYLALIILGSAGWITNVVWTFQQHSVADLALGIVGAFIPFIGAAHGIYLWFV